VVSPRTAAAPRSRAAAPARPGRGLVLAGLSGPIWAQDCSGQLDVIAPSWALRRGADESPTAVQIYSPAKRRRATAAATRIATPGSESISTPNWLRTPRSRPGVYARLDLYDRFLLAWKGFHFGLKPRKGPRGHLARKRASSAPVRALRGHGPRAGVFGRVYTSGSTSCGGAGTGCSRRLERRTAAAAGRPGRGSAERGYRSGTSQV